MPSLALQVQTDLEVEESTGRDGERMPGALYALVLRTGWSPHHPRRLPGDYWKYSWIHFVYWRILFDRGFLRVSTKSR
jgi:hypothetical protein